MTSGPEAIASESVLQCEPALPFFCANIHIGCAGRSKVPTQAFTLEIGAPVSRAVFANDDVLESRVAVSFDKDDPAVVIRDGRDWIRLQSDGTFSHRMYRNGQALMTRGSCEPSKP